MSDKLIDVIETIQVYIKVLNESGSKELFHKVKSLNPVTILSADTRLDLQILLNLSDTYAVTLNIFSALVAMLDNNILYDKYSMLDFINDNVVKYYTTVSEMASEAIYNDIRDRDGHLLNNNRPTFLSSIYRLVLRKKDVKPIEDYLCVLVFINLYVRIK